MADIYTQVKDVIVNITTAKAAGVIGLGKPLVIAGKAAKAAAYTDCSNLDEVVKAGFAAETEVYKACAAIFAQKNKPKAVAVVATDGKISDWLTANKDKDFRQVIPVFGEEDSTVAELCTAVSALEDKMLFLEVDSKEELPETKSERVVAIVYAGASDYVNAAVVGESAGRAAGSFTYKNLVLQNVEAEDYSPAEVEAIHDAGGICILKKAGDVVTSEGTTTDGEYIDIVDSKDYIISNIVYQVQKALNDNAKLPFDNIGISQIESIVTGVLADAYGQGIIATNADGTPAYSTTFATREETSASDISNRTYNGGHFSFKFAGAIHNGQINGVVEI